MTGSFKIHEKIATVFGVGYIPIAPGTFGSLAGLILCLLLHKFIVIYILTFIALFLIGIISSGIVEKGSGTKDPSHVVIDEFACIFPVFLFVPLNIPLIVAGFILYRLMDIIKPPPIRSLEKIQGGAGIMLDDLLAAIYTNLILQAIIFIFKV